jgi:hypothetical protein
MAGDEMRWSFGPDVPTDDFFDGRPLTDVWNLQEAVESFISYLETARFLTWEAVVRYEQGLPLTARQEDALDGLINFGDPGDNRIHYIDEFPRPSEPWFAILNKLVPYLLIEPFRTSDEHWEVQSHSWHRIVTALKEYGEGLSLPPGVGSISEVVPAELQHRLWLQHAFDMLAGLGQEEELFLDPEDPWRVEVLIERLQECKDSVAYFKLTPESILDRVTMPERDRPIFLKMMQQKLGLESPRQPIAERL